MGQVKTHTQPPAGTNISFTTICRFPLFPQLEPLQSGQLKLGRGELHVELPSGQWCVIDRYLPDPFVFVLVLTLIAGLAAVLTQGTGPLEVVTIWGDGFWSLLTFSMQMLLVLVTGYMMASTPLVRRGLTALASLANSAGGAILLVSFVSLAASWINWGFGLVVGALFARELARTIRVDYRLLVASAYSVYRMARRACGLDPIVHRNRRPPVCRYHWGHPASQTVFSVYNLVIVAALFIAITLVNRAMLPREDEAVYIDPALLKTALRKKAASRHRQTALKTALFCLC